MECFCGNPVGGEANTTNMVSAAIICIQVRVGKPVSSPRKPHFPSSVHGQAAEAVVDFSKRSTAVQAVLIVNSCARGTATEESDLDIALLVEPMLPVKEREFIEREWRSWYENNPVFRDLERLSRFSRVHLDLFDGQWAPEIWDDGGGPDAFEIEIGNRVAHAAPLWERTEAFADLRAKWLPYYGEDLRAERLQMVSLSCQLNLDRVVSAVNRNLHFYAFDRLYYALQEFLQALFIARRVYPIAYNKWIREQVEGWLGGRQLYSELPAILEIQRLQSNELMDKAEHLRRLLRTLGA